MAPPPLNIPPLGVGLVLHPNAEYLDLCHDLIEHEVDFYELSPETCWQGSSQNLSPSVWSDVFADLRQRTGRPFVGHGLALSPGTAAETPAEIRRLEAWVDRIAADHARFNFLWYTEHLGWSTDGASVAQLPLPLPPTDQSVHVVTSRLGRLKRILPIVGFENQVSYFNLGRAADQPPFWNRIAHEGGLWILLDIHNAYTECLNAKADLDAYLDAIDLTRVLEIHLSGGSESDPAWLPSHATLRLDSHDGPVPDAVWRAFERIRPRCPNLRAVVVERLDGTLAPDDVAPYRDEIRRARNIFFKSTS